MKVRAIAKGDNEVGMERYKLYKSAFSRINKSIEDGYYLEAITLVESILSDRLESRLTCLLKKNFGFNNLGQLIKKIKEIETDEAFKRLIVEEVDAWRNERNFALHEMVKIEAGVETGWDERIGKTEKAAKEGLKVLKKVKKKW